MSELVNGEQARKLATELIHSYFTTQVNPLVRHHIDSYDQFLQNDIQAIIHSNNPIQLFKNPKGSRSNTTNYKYKVEIYIGGEDSTKLYIGTPTIVLGNDVRALFPNEARLRNLTYGVQVQADIFVKVSIKLDNGELLEKEITIEKMNLCTIPLMLHSRYCMLHNKPSTVLQQMGECPYDQGGYFIVDGSEKVLVTRQEGAFNTLWINNQPRDPAVQIYASISSLNPISHEVKRVSFYWTREKIKGIYKFGQLSGSEFKPAILEVGIPYVLKPVPIFVLFRAMGLQTDKEIIETIFPDLNHPETALLADLLIPSINAAAPFLDTYSSIQYIKLLTKGFSEFHVLDILHNHLFPHVDDTYAGTRRAFLGECVRKILRVIQGLEAPASRDDTRNQRLLTSGFLCQILFQNIYKTYLKRISLNIDNTFAYNESVYSDENFVNIFAEGNRRTIFAVDHIKTGLMRGFKGKWLIGNNKEESGLIQEMSRLSYIDFMSHVRRVLLNFDTSMKLTGPRRLNPSQYGYFCTSETPSGGSIGVTKNLSMFTSISTVVHPKPLIDWLFSKGGIVKCEYVTPSLAAIMVPVYINSGILGYTRQPRVLTNTLRLLKRTGCLPPFSSSGFSIPERKVFIYLDEGRPLRPLIICEPRGSLRPFAVQSWRDLVVGSLPLAKEKNIQVYSTEFYDPLANKQESTLEDYVAFLKPYQCKIEYIDPYEHNECLIANLPEYIIPETTHMEVHPSSIMGIIAGSIPFANHNQSPRNQLGSSQSKQGLSLYITNWKHRYDNTANILCYGQTPLVRTIYQDYIGGGLLPYGENVILAMGMYGGYNQEDGIIMNMDAMQRGQFRSINYRSYEAFEEDDDLAHTQTRIGHPKNIPAWLSLKTNLDYGKIDDSGIIKPGEYVDQNTVIVSRYMVAGDKITDASITPQVWTRGHVEDVVVLVNPKGLRLVKIRITQDRMPELGDKFCMTPDHNVLTPTGWISITEVTTDTLIAQLDQETHEIQFVNPKEVISSPHNDALYEIITEEGSHMVTALHRVYVQDSYGKIMFIHAYLLYHTYKLGFLLYDENLELHLITKIIYHLPNTIHTTVHCVSVPSGIFLAYRINSEVGFWTGNSNRHGQKGTLNILYRGHDMPRTADGIVPDMIMNPTAIPSRMTIGQILEMMLGNVAANVGAIGNGTTFMNDGSPHEMLGSILEQLGLNKLSNQILYNGMNGEQMTADIYMGVVYGMRLKHMTEDKWNARGEGRREQRTHQPTGGRGNEGGLKIGEMERDAIVAHGITSFLQESMMKRSDGSSFIICNGCGTLPIYNEKESFYLCPLCDGPVQYIGNSVNTLDPIPSPERPTATFSKIEMPYATKLFIQEMETYTNMSMRILTTKSVIKLKGIESVEELVEGSIGSEQPFSQIIYPEYSVPELNTIIQTPTTANVTQELAKINAIQVNEESMQEQLPADGALLPETQPQLQVQQPQVQQPQVQQPQPQQPQPQQPQPQQPQQPQVTRQVRIRPRVQQGGAQEQIEPEFVTQTDVPILVIDTGPEAMASEGLRPPRDSIPVNNQPVLQEESYNQPSRPRRQSRLPQQQQQQQDNNEEEPPKQVYTSAPVKVMKLG